MTKRVIRESVPFEKKSAVGKKHRRDGGSPRVLRRAGDEAMTVTPTEQ